IHPALIGGGEYVRGRALLDLEGQLLRAGEVEEHGHSGMIVFQRPSEVAEGLGQRGSSKHAEGGRLRVNGAGRQWQAKRGQREPQESAHPTVPFAIMTSVDLMTANTCSPTLSRSRSAEFLVITATSSCSPIATRISAINPSTLIATTRPRSWLRALRSSPPPPPPPPPPTSTCAPAPRTF